MLDRGALAAKAELSQEIEQGKVEPRLTTLLILADGLSVTIDELLAGLWVPLERKPSPHRDSW